jgi:hypothetical protein
MGDNGYQFKKDREPGMVRWEPTFTWGNVGCIVAIVFSVGIAYDKLQGRMDAAEKQTEEVKITSEKQTAEVRATAQRLAEGQIQTNLELRELQTVIREEGRKTRGESPLR